MGAGTIYRPARVRLWLSALLVTIAALGLMAASASPPTPTDRAVVALHIDGPIGPASADYFARSLEEAQERGAALVVLRMDTPGGLDISMRDMIRRIIASPVPVAAYVAPGGSRAASAGTYIMYASHVAAMAPGTNLGAATPIQLGGAPQPFEPAPADDPASPAPEPAAEDEDGEGQTQGQTTSDAKAVNDSVAYIRALAQLRGRNADWAEQAVRQAASLAADAALVEGVIDIVATDIDDLLAQADGRTVTVGGAPVELAVQGLAVQHIRPDWRHSLLSVIANPNVALMLMMIGVYGVIFEFMSPGALYPGVIGAISLLLGLYALAVLPVSFAGVALLVLGLGLMTAEAFAPSFGALGVGGAAAFILGGMIFIDTDAPGFRVSVALVAGLAVASLAFSLIVVRMALTSRGRRIVSGREQMIGMPGIVQDWNGGAGHVFAHSERWRAVSAAPLQPGDRVQVTGIADLTLTVAPAGADDRSEAGEQQ
jgi:membrane-bound serine protease (ClpP class)